MARWTLTQIRQVRGLRSQAMVDAAMVERARVDVMAATRYKLALSLIDMSHAFAVEPHLADFQFSEAEEDERPWLIRVRCWWEPDVRTIEILGGRGDGTLFEVERPGEPIRFVPPTPPVWHSPDALTEPMPMPDALVAEMTGWDETSRHWVYEVKR